MKNSLSSIIQTYRKSAQAKIASSMTTEKYGLNLQSSFPLPSKIPNNSGKVRYHHQGIGVLFSEASTTEIKVVEKYFSLPLQEKLPLQAVLAYAQLEDGLLVYLPANAATNESHIIELEADGNTAIAFILIVAAKNSKNSVVISSRTASPSHTIVQVVCDEASTLELVTCEPQGVHPYFSLQYATIHDHVQFKSLQLIRNADMVQSFTKTDTPGEHTQVLQSHIAFGSRQSKHDLYSEISHSGSHSQSQMFSKVILRDQSHTIYRGLVKMDSQTMNSNSSQKEHTLLLGPQAKIDVVPMLEITNDAISCSHSASISNLDPEQLFYLQSRGFSYEEAESLIIQGFYGDVLKHFSNLALCAIIHDYIAPEQLQITNPVVSPPNPY